MDRCSREYERKFIIWPWSGNRTIISSLCSRISTKKYDEEPAELEVQLIDHSNANRVMQDHKFSSDTISPRWETSRESREQPGQGETGCNKRTVLKYLGLILPCVGLTVSLLLSYIFCRNDILKSRNLLFLLLLTMLLVYTAIAFEEDKLVFEQIFCFLFFVVGYFWVCSKRRKKNPATNRVMNMVLNPFPNSATNPFPNSATDSATDSTDSATNPFPNSATNPAPSLAPNLATKTAPEALGYTGLKFTGLHCYRNAFLQALRPVFHPDCEKDTVRPGSATALLLEFLELYEQSVAATNPKERKNLKESLHEVADQLCVKIGFTGHNDQNDPGEFGILLFDVLREEKKLNSEEKILEKYMHDTFYTTFQKKVSCQNVGCFDIRYGNITQSFPMLLSFQPEQYFGNEDLCLTDLYDFGRQSGNVYQCWCPNCADPLIQVESDQNVLAVPNSTSKLEHPVLKYPPSLFIQLNRATAELVDGEYIEYKHTRPLHIPLTLTLKDDDYKDQYFYNIKAVICHYGNDIRAGHYRTYIKDGTEWVMCDDMNIDKGVRYETIRDQINTCGFWFLYQQDEQKSNLSDQKGLR